MYDDDTTISEFGEAADDVMTELAAEGFRGMSKAQADLVVRMAKLLDFAARKFASAIETGGRNELINRAANHALAMRMHGATLRGISGAELLEDLCDAMMGRYASENPPAPNPEKLTIAHDPVPTGCLTVEEAMTLLGVNRFTQLARSIGTSSSLITFWRKKGHIPLKKSEVVREVYRGMQVRAAA